MTASERLWTRWVVLVVGGLTLWRVAWLHWNGTDLFVDEAQYWFWGQHLDFGYYSKPPMIGWVIRAVTELAGSSDPFWVRLPGPLLHMLTAVLLMQSAAMLYGARVARIVGPVYVALPVVTVGTFLFSTDTVMLPFFALALWMYLRCLQRPFRRDAVIAGLAIGFGLLSKYAAIYFGIGVLLAAAVQTRARMTVSDAAAMVLAAALVIAPNIWWNLNHQAVTVRHTMDNADWSGEGLHPGKALEFLAAQFVVVGPVVFAALLWAVVRALRGRLRGPDLTLLLFSMPIVALVVGQALMSRAYANWAVSAYVAGTILAVRLLIDRPRLLWMSQALHLALALAVPIMLSMPERFTQPGGAPLFKRYLGRAAVSHWAADVARNRGLDAIVAADRDLSADLHYTLRGQALAIYAPPPRGFPANYYEQEFAVPEALSGDTLYLTFAEAPCEAARLLAEDAILHGAYAGRTARAYLVPAACYQSKGRDLGSA